LTGIGHLVASLAECIATQIEFGATVAKVWRFGHIQPIIWRHTPAKQEGDYMSQMPPPPPSQPAPMGGAGSVGSNKKTYSILAYVLGWITGLIFLFVGKDDSDVKWNAANSVVFFGGLSIIIIVLSLIPVVGLLAFLIFLAGFIYWIIFLVQGLQGNGERISAPGIGQYINKYVDQLANSVK
jgi:uncharacterized membrane protein